MRLHTCDLLAQCLQNGQILRVLGDAGALIFPGLATSNDTVKNTFTNKKVFPIPILLTAKHLGEKTFLLQLSHEPIIEPILRLDVFRFRPVLF